MDAIASYIDRAAMRHPTASRAAENDRRIGFTAGVDACAALIELGADEVRDLQVRTALKLYARQIRVKVVYPAGDEA